MKFVEINDGQSLNVELISYFEDMQNYTRIMSMDGNVYESRLPYQQFKDFLNYLSSRSEKSLEVLAKSAFKPVP